MNNYQLPSYYSILPASVRYDTQLTDFEKILFSELTALSTVKGYAFVSNTHLSTLYNKDIRSISRALNKLHSLGHVNIVIDQINGNERRVYIVTPALVLKDVDDLGGIDKNVHRGIDKNVHSNAFINKESFNKDLINKGGLPEPLLAFYEIFQNKK
jgi:hypothetical protein